MRTPEERAAQGRADGRSSWERPTITFAGTIALLVRGGSAGGKQFGSTDGDATNFQACAPHMPPGQGGCS
jgi:hypothetical protein